MRRSWGIATAAAVALGLGAGAHDLWAKDKEKKGPHLRYAPNYAAAWAEAKARNTLLYAIFHKDN